MNCTHIRDAWFCRLLRLATVSLLATVLFASLASAQYCTRDECDECSLRHCDSLPCCNAPPEMWIIYTRHLPRCSNLDQAFERLIFKRYDCKCGRFVKESLESFLAGEASMPSMFYLHGNTLKHKGAVKSFWQVYEKMRCCPGKKRLVCWSWPAQRVHKGFPIRKMIMDNLHTKLVYAEYQGYYLAKLVQRMSLSQRVMLSGHSYGAISAATAAHWLGGGSLRGLTLEGGEGVERPNLRLGMISGAFDNDALLPGHRYGQAFVAAEKVLVTRNIEDKTLKKWPDVSHRGCRALGVTGLNAKLLGQYRHKLCQLTMTSDVGRSHYLTPHLRSTRFVGALCCVSFPECAACLAERTDSVPTVKVERRFADRNLPEFAISLESDQPSGEWYGRLCLAEEASPSNQPKSAAGKFSDAGRLIPRRASLFL